MGLSTILTASLLALRLFAAPGLAAPAPAAEEKAVAAATSWWLPNIARQGTVPYSSAGSGYQIYRNVQNYGAKGDGVTDDTAAINAAISAGNRCGNGCDSQTTTPAIVYFPPGTYMVSSPILLYYYTHLIGDATNLPTLKSTANFTGIAVIDSNPGWYGATNNFFRQIRNFKVDVSGQPINTGTGIRWRVAQATSIQNVQFIMSGDTSTNNKQQGIWGEDGSGGWLSDLTFTGGALGIWIGNQQFTSRNLVFNGCQTANVYSNILQTETAYMQGNPDARVPYTSQSKYADPDWSTCTDSLCARTYGIRVVNSSNTLIYGAGMYSFFNNYDGVTCVNGNNCQDNIIDVRNSQVHFFGISTKASINMITLNGQAAVFDRDNRNTFCGTVASFETS
ncbi:glycoside hydrolase family 55 protein [Trichoderma longibrachiatum ATCC 18648]|uniref:Glycoside hydrolase family 55 protein n=1 Tax=Trichoderma longibrachiatum ATCC 18648 TaxID=983965 RepID=A0A2T4C2E7_TRILO|nr:glycoside hydrolase family 55 protein [Trichoderma longibrachiatum ATCC 18648]